MGEDLQSGAAGSTDAAAGSGSVGAGIGGLEGEPGTEDLFLNMARSGEAASANENGKVFRNRVCLSFSFLFFLFFFFFFFFYLSFVWLTPMS